MLLKRVLKEAFSPPHRGLMVRSAILWGLGNIGAQAITHYSTQHKDAESISFSKNDKEFKIDWYRVCTTSYFGVGSCIGPAAYYRHIKNLRSSVTTAEFVSLTPWDSLFGTLNLATFFPLMGYVQGRTKSVQQAKEDMKMGFTPALLLGGAVLPAVLFTNWRFIPAPYQLHCASLFALVASCCLSWVELEQHKHDAGAPRIRKMEGVRFDRRTSVKSG